MDTDTTSDRAPGSLRTKLAIVGLSGAVFTAAALGLAGIASAQQADGDPTIEAPADEAPAEEAPAEPGDDTGDDGEYPELSPDDEAVFERFEQCLSDAGLDDDALWDADHDGTLTDDDIDRIDQIFEDCEPILDDLSGDAELLLEEGFCDDADLEDWELDGFELDGWELDGFELDGWELDGWELDEHEVPADIEESVSA